MSKRAQYTGTSPVRVVWPAGAVDADITHEEIIEPGHWLSDDAPAALRDDLLKRDDFSERQQPDQSKADTTAKKED